MKYCYHCMAEIKSPEEQYCPECGQRYNVHYAQSFELPAGAYLCDGRYLVGKSLGTGGFGITYIGFDLKINKKIVIKETFYSGIFQRNSQNITLSDPLRVTYDDSISLSEIMNKTQKECFCLSKAESFNNIVKVYDWFTENNTAYIITEYINGKTLYERVTESGKYEWRELYAKFKPLMQSLSQLHKAELLHRDIKPLNIMIRKGYRSNEDFVLIDFGLARSSQTKTLASVGIAFSPGYSPFEQRTFTKKDGTFTDVYSLAATMYFALTGTAPIDEAAGSVDENFPLLRSLRSSGEIPAHVASAFEYALQPDYRNRCQTIDEFVNCLDGGNNVVYETPIESPYNRSQDYNSFENRYSDGSDPSATRYANYASPLQNNSFPVQTPPKRNNVPEPMRRPPAPVQYSQPRNKNGLFNLVICLCVIVVILGAAVILRVSGVVDVGEIFGGLSESENSSDGVSQISVPNLSEKSVDDAERILREKGLNWEITYQPTDSAEPDTIVSQFPLPGDTLGEGDTVDIYVAQAVPEETKKSESVTVPDVVGEYYYDAADKLINEGFRVEWKDSYSETVDADKIVRQDPESGTSSVYGSTVTLYVAKGIDPSQYIEIGDYAGRDINEVKSELEEQGLKVTYSVDTSSNLPSGTIISQNIESGKLCKKGSTVNFVVAKPAPDTEANTSSSEPPDESESISGGLDIKSNEKVNLTGSYTAPIFHGVMSSSHLDPSGSYTYTEQNILRDNGTCWAEGVGGNGVGEYVMFYDGNVQSVSQCTLINGYNENANSFKNNGRLTLVTFEFSDGRTLTYQIDSETMNEQTFYFGEVIQTTSLKVIISDAKAGDKYQDTCLSLIVPK